MKWFSAGVLALMLAACTTISSGRRHCLEVRQHPTQQVLGIFTLQDDNRFSLTFIHSVSGTSVRDEYRVESDRIVQEAESFETHGAGLPSNIDEPGVTGWEQQDGQFVIRMNRPIPKLVVRTDSNYRNRLHIGGEEVNLNNWKDQALEIVPVACSIP